MKVAELTGVLLDHWVAVAEGHEWRQPSILEQSGLKALNAYERAWGRPTPQYSTDWFNCGPLIEKYKMYIEWDEDGYWVANSSGSATTEGSTAQEAICRAVVRAKFGGEVPEVAP